MNYDEFMDVVRQKREDEFKRTQPEFIITMASLILSLMGCIGVASSLLPEINVLGLVLGSVFMAQGLLTMMGQLELIPFTIWGWLY